MRGSQKVWIGLAAGFGALMVGIIILADHGHLPYLTGPVQHYDDKMIHFGFAAVLAFLLENCTRGRSFGIYGIRLPVASTLLMTAMGLEEVSQRYIPYRQFDWFDLLSDLLGITLGAVMALWWTARLPATDQDRDRAVLDPHRGVEVAGSANHDSP